MSFCCQMTKMKFTVRGYLAFALLAFLLPSCDRHGQLVTKEPAASEVAGRYRLSSTLFGSQTDSKIADQAKDAFIELGQNGRATLHKVPLVPESSNKDFFVQEFRSGTGSFTISPLGSTTTSEFYGLYLSCGELPDPMNVPRLRQKGDSLSLSIDYFDGDFVPRMIFTREKQD